MSNLTVIPVWKDGVTLTAADRLHELALLAQTKPEKFERWVLVRMGTLPEGRLDFAHFQFGCDLPQQIGMFEIGKNIAMEDSAS